MADNPKNAVANTLDTLDTFPKVVLTTVNLLENNGIAVVLGRALAAVYHMKPRLTADVDINVSCDEQHTSQVLDILSKQLHAHVTHKHRETAEHDGQSIGLDIGSNIKLDIFFHIGNFSDFIFENARQVRFGDQQVTIMSPESIIACKAIFNRDKDWLDIRNIVSETPLDISKLRYALCDIAHMSDRYDRIIEIAQQSEH